MTLHERQIEGARVRFKSVGLPYTEVFYEDLVADEGGFDSLFEFLGVEPAPVSSSLQKIEPDAHEELIENYGEVRDALAERSSRSCSDSGTSRRNPLPPRPRWR